MIPLRSDNPTRTFPLITILLILANVLIFAYQLSPVAQEHNFTEKFGAVASQITSQPFKLILYRGAERWFLLPTLATLITCMFLHGSIAHIISNMLYLWIFGPNIEDRLGHLRFTFFYIICGLVATLTHIAAQPSSAVPLIGASGAIASVMGAYLLLFPRARILCLFLIWIFPRFIRLPALIFLGLWIALQFWSAHTIPKEMSAVAWFAHIGGFLAGFLLIHFFKRRRDTYEED